ncbi:MAG: hypothetical protein IJ339_02745 [Oscillospiraceae bacterium]|nr:hypothetical protein [Oscillospiraceae bacterium]MBQ7816263.1 hypothetical protein [Oscillospiraceae bacterium]
MNESKVVKNIITAAQPYLDGKTVQDIVVGISLISCQLSDGSVGVSYVLRHGLPPSCSAFAYAKDVIGKPAAEVAAWLMEKDDYIGRSIGSSVLSAASQQIDIPDDNNPDKMFGIEFGAEDTVGMIGLIGPVAKSLQSRVKEVIVFDESISAFGGNVSIHPMSEQPQLLPKCNKMIITGSSTINGSIDGLLNMCQNATEIAMVGSSTPMFPQGWADTKVTSLSGSWWKNEHKEEIFKAISCGSGVMELHPYMIKKALYIG